MTENELREVYVRNLAGKLLSAIDDMLSDDISNAQYQNGLKRYIAILEPEYVERKDRK